jgi:hypothetical protein
MLSNIESASLMSTGGSLIFCFFELFGQAALSLMISFVHCKASTHLELLIQLSCKHCLVDCCGMESRTGCLWIERGEGCDIVSVVLVPRCPWCRRGTSRSLDWEDWEVWVVVGCHWALT